MLSSIKATFTKSSSSVGRVIRSHHRRGAVMMTPCFQQAILTATNPTSRWHSTRLDPNGTVEFHDHRSTHTTQDETVHVIEAASSDDNCSVETTPSTNRVTPPSHRSSIDLGEQPRVSLLMELKDEVGILHEVLKYFWKYDLNVSRIESRPVQSSRRNNHPTNASSVTPVFDFYLDFHGTLDDPPVQKLMNDLEPLTEKLLVLDEKDVHWFPRHICKTKLNRPNEI